MHCVFTTEQPHGDIYTPIGQTINNMHRTNYPVLPHMVYLPEVQGNMRKELNIPENAIVFGRYGGKESFDIPFVYDSIKETLVKEFQPVNGLSEKNKMVIDEIKAHSNSVAVHISVMLYLA
jgi:hypothetical protein